MTLKTLDGETTRAMENKNTSDKTEKPNNLPVPTTRKQKRERLIEALIENPDNVYQAAIKAGYKPSYANCSKFYKTVKELQASEDFRKAVDDYIQGSDLTTKVLRVSKIDDKVLKMIEEDPEKYVKLQSVPKQIKQQYGLLAPDNAPQEAVRVTIQQMQVLLRGDFAPPKTLQKALHYSDNNSDIGEVIDITKDK